MHVRARLHGFMQRFQQRNFWKRFLRNVAIYFSFFKIIDLWFGDEPLSLNSLLAAAIVSGCMGLMDANPAHRPTDETTVQDTLQELQQRRATYYLGLYGFFVLAFFALLAVLALIALAAFWLANKVPPDFWRTGAKAFAAAACMCFLLVVVSFVSDRLEAGRLKSKLK